MPPKKRNAYYFFMLDFQKKYKISSLKEASVAAAPYWNNLSKAEKAAFEQQALRDRNNFQARKFTSDGEPIDLIAQETQKKENEIQAMKENISMEISIAIQQGSIKDKVFFIIHINNYCYKESEDMYYPCEIAITPFSLATGVSQNDVYHKMVKPGNLPIGYTGPAKQHSQETHKIPTPEGDKVEVNLSETFFQVLEFLSSHTPGSKRYPPLYCHDKYMRPVQSVLDNWCSNYEPTVNLEVYNLQYMFRVLKSSLSGETEFTDGLAASEIERDVYAYVTGIACEFHDICSAEPWCSRSMVIRQAYMICDNCCHYVNIDLVPGRHVPINSKIPGGSCDYSTYSVVSSKRQSSSRSRGADTDSQISFVGSVSDRWETDSTTSTRSSRTFTSENGFPVLSSPKHFPTYLENENPAWGSFDPLETSSTSKHDEDDDDDDDDEQSDKLSQACSVEPAMSNLSLDSNIGLWSGLVSQKPVITPEDFPTLGSSVRGIRSNGDIGRGRGRGRGRGVGRTFRS